jgi:hypothetical protein
MSSKVLLLLTVYSTPIFIVTIIIITTLTLIYFNFYSKNKFKPKSLHYFNDEFLTLSKIRILDKTKHLKSKVIKNTSIPELEQNFTTEIEAQPEIRPEITQSEIRPETQPEIRPEITRSEIRPEIRPETQVTVVPPRLIQPLDIPSSLVGMERSLLSLPVPMLRRRIPTIPMTIPTTMATPITINTENVKGTCPETKNYLPKYVIQQDNLWDRNNQRLPRIDKIEDIPGGLLNYDLKLKEQDKESDNLELMDFLQDTVINPNSIHDYSVNSRNAKK